MNSNPLHRQRAPSTIHHVSAEEDDATEDESAEESTASVAPSNVDAFFAEPPRFVALERGALVPGTHRVALTSGSGGDVDQHRNQWQSTSTSNAAYSTSSCEVFEKWTTFSASVM